MSRSAYAGRKAPKKKIMRRAGIPPELHCMLVPAGEVSLLLPTALVAEVIDYQPTTAIEETPAWLLGEIEWDDRRVPVFCFTALINGSEPGEAGSRAKIMVLKSLSGSTRVPYFGLLMDGLPSPVQVNDSDLEELGDEKVSLGVFSRVRFQEQEAIIPDMDRLAHLVTHATYGALPITQLGE
ncbi:MAG: chemotaxis protein CheW [Lysobacterales bacterium]|jgi:chemosensory pili system protein ChpC